MKPAKRLGRPYRRVGRTAQRLERDTAAGTPHGAPARPGAAGALSARPQAVPRALDRQPTGKLLAARRQALGWSQAGLAERLGAPQGSVCQLEDGRRPVTIDELVAWAGALQVDPTLVTGDDPGPNERTRQPGRSRQAPSPRISRELALAVSLDRLGEAGVLGFSSRVLHHARLGREALTVRQARVLLESHLVDPAALPAELRPLAGALLALGSSPSTGRTARGSGSARRAR